MLSQVHVCLKFREIKIDRINILSSMLCFALNKTLYIIEKSCTRNKQQTVLSTQTSVTQNKQSLEYKALN